MRNIALRLMYVGTAYHGWHRSVKQTCRWHVCSVGRSGFAAGREPSQGPAGGMTRKQVSKRVTWKALQPEIRRADVGIGPYAEER